MYHTIIIVGNLGRDPEMRYTPSGQAVTSFNVAVSDGFGERKKTIWFRVSAWDKQAENVNNFLRKGSKVLVEGRLVATDKGTPRIWNRADGSPGASFEVNATVVRFLSSRTEGEAEPGGGDEIPESDAGDDIPF